MKLLAVSLTLYLAAILAFTPVAQASIKIVEEHESNASIAGASVRFVEMKKEIVAPQVPDVLYHTTDTRFIYTIEPGSSFEDYGIVQFIRGCEFESQLIKGKVEKQLKARDYFGKVVLFKHPHWQIDNDTNDPVYSAYEGVSRFALLRWNDDPASLDADNAHYYQSKKPTGSTVFVTDLPGVAAYDGKYKTASNVSLELKTCIFRIADLPKTTTPDGDGVDEAKALWCAAWDHKFVWNFVAKKMDRPKQIDPFCALP